MHYERMPLFPRQCDSQDCLQVPLFTQDSCARGDSDSCCRTVRLYNPCKRGEYADVELCVDGCGNLSVCVHRSAGCGACERRRIPCCDRW